MYSLQIFGKKALEIEQLSNTTIQENNSTFPTATKLAKKIIDNYNDIAQKEEASQYQSVYINNYCETPIIPDGKTILFPKALQLVE